MKKFLDRGGTLSPEQKNELNAAVQSTTAWFQRVVPLLGLGDRRWPPRDAETLRLEAREAEYQPPVFDLGHQTQRPGAKVPQAFGLSVDMVPGPNQEQGMKKYLHLRFLVAQT